MSSAWLLPEHIADVLPAEARRVEELRRVWLDLARTFGFELVAPPLLEHLDSLLSGTGRQLNLKTFKLVDQLSGRSLGLRADTTPQVARIDAHLLNRRGVTRLCYCGPVVHTRPAGPNATREPLQMGVEIFGHSGLEADLEVLELALSGTVQSGIQNNLTVDLADARIVRELLKYCQIDTGLQEAIVEALAAKDAGTLRDLTGNLASSAASPLQSLLDCYGGLEVLEKARCLLPASQALSQALDDLAWLAGHLQSAFPQIHIGFDLADMSGFTYYSGIRFAVYADCCTDAIIRGGRYDEVGAVFGRKRPAVGCSLDLKTLADLTTPSEARPAIRAPWGEDAGLQAAIRQLRQLGETVVCMLPGHEDETQEFESDRELVAVDGQWVLRSL